MAKLARHNAALESEIDELLADASFANDNEDADDLLYGNFDEAIIFKINENNRLQEEIFVA